MNRLALLKSDLKDCEDPKMLRRYPHLGSEVHKEELRKKIAEEEAKLTIKVKT